MPSGLLNMGWEVQACPGLRLVAYASESVTAFEYVWSAIKPVRPSDQWKSYMIQVWAGGSTFRVKDKEGIIVPKSSLIMLIFLNNCIFGSKFWIRPHEAGTYLVDTLPNGRMQP